MTAKTEQDVMAALRVVLEKDDKGAIKIFAEALVRMAIQEGKITFAEKEQWIKDLGSETTFASAIERYGKLQAKMKVRSIIKDRINN